MTEDKYSVQSNRIFSGNNNYDGSSINSSNNDNRSLTQQIYYSPQTRMAPPQFANKANRQYYTRQINPPQTFHHNRFQNFRRPQQGFQPRQNQYNYGIQSSFSSHNNNDNNNINGGGDSDQKSEVIDLVIQHLVKKEPIEFLHPICNFWIRVTADGKDQKYEISQNTNILYVYSSRKQGREELDIAELVKDNRIRLDSNSN